MFPSLTAIAAPSQGDIFNELARGHFHGVRTQRVVGLAAVLALHYFTPAMIADVRQHLEAVPFEPFHIVMSSGQRYHVPTPDHANVGPRGRLVVWFDDGSGIMLAGLHITGIEKQATKKNGSA